MDPTIKKILKANYVDSVFHTHVSLIAPKGKFHFSSQVLEEFWDTYCKLIDTDNLAMTGIAEKPQQYLPVIVDVDLKVRDDDKDSAPVSLYTEEQLETSIKIYHSVLRQIVDNCTDTDLTCVVLEKDLYQQNRNDTVYLKHGFHLHFPYIFLSKVNQEVQLLPRIREAFKSIGVFSHIEPESKVVDNVTAKPWLLYGSKKSEDSQPYLYTKVYNSEMKIISLEEAFKYYQIFDQKERLIPLQGKVKYYLPRILSILPYNRSVKELKRGLISPLKEKRKSDKVASVNHRKLSTEEALKIARELLPMLSDYRAQDRNEWMTVGWILYNITDGDPEGLNLWCEFSARDEENYDENNCIYQWERMIKKDLTIGTLKYFASIDNPLLYKKYKSSKTDKHVVESLEGSHNDIAKALHAEYGDEFVCASITNKVWFQFVNHHWEQIEEGVYLKEKISSKIILKFQEAAKKIYEENTKTEGKENLPMIKIKQLNKMITNLKNNTYKTNVMREAMEVFYDPRFRDRLDTDPYLIAFKNGIYDLRLNIFRPGRPEDFLSKTMPINYIPFSEDDEKVQDVYTFLEQVFPDKNIRKYFMDVSSDVFVGGNHEKIVQFWTGEGDNGKSVTQKFFELMLGKLSIKGNTNIVTGKKPNAGSAFADLARAGGGVRLMTLEEPDADEMINTGIFKHLSGNDAFYARDLFERGKDGREIIPMFKLIFVCNKLPRIKAADRAVWNRVRVILFESVFCKPDDPAPETYEEQLRQKRFPMDKQFVKKIPGLVEAFAWVLLQHRLKISNSVRIEPEKVRAATEIYRRQNDIYRQFIEENIVEDKDKTLSLAELYNLFKDWFRDSLPGHTVPVKNEVEEHFCKIWGSMEPGKKWKGYRERILKDDVMEGDAVVLTEDDLREENKNNHD